LNDPELHEIPLPVEPAGKSHLRWRDGVAYGLTGDADMTFTLDKPRRVMAVRLRFSYELAPNESARFLMSWKRSGVKEVADTERQFTTQIKAPPKGQPQERTLTVWVNDTIDQIRLHPDRKPYVFHLSEIVLLVPAGAAP